MCSVLLPLGDNPIAVNMLPCNLKCNNPLRESFGIYLLNLQRMDKIMETGVKEKTRIISILWQKYWITYMSFMRIGYILPTRTYTWSGTSITRWKLYVFLLIASISVWARLVARNVITLYCINTRTLYHGLSTTDVRTETRSERY